MKMLVTGGAGFIGSHVTDALIGQGHEVVVIDDLSSGKREYAHPRALFVKLNILENLDDLFSQHGFDVVFHLAAIPRVQFSIKEPRKTHEANVNGTFNLLEACRIFGVKRFVFSSSSSVYGDQPSLPLVETMKPNPMSPYALHKFIGETYCNLYHVLYGLETISLRYFNVYGERQNPAGDYACLIPKFIRFMKQGAAPTIFGDGEQTRDFTYVGDVVDANIAAARTQKEECFGETFNIGAGHEHSVNEVVRSIKKILSSHIEPVHGAAVIEPRNTRADVQKVRRLLGWEPKTEFEEGLKRTIAFFTDMFKNQSS